MLNYQRIRKWAIASALALAVISLVSLDARRAVAGTRCAAWSGDKPRFGRGISALEH